MQTRRTLTQRIFLLLLTAMLCMPADGDVRRRKVKAHRSPDSLAMVTPSPEMPSIRKMSTTVYPIQIAVAGRVVQIHSNHNQLLPIYTQNGVLYLTARLNKGKNWIGGLPAGRYFINNKPVTIN